LITNDVPELLLTPSPGESFCRQGSHFVAAILSILLTTDAPEGVCSDGARRCGLAGADAAGRSAPELKQDRSKVSNPLEDYFKLDYEEKVAGIACR